MNKKPKQYNGLKHRSVLRARGRILREAERKGFITNARAKKLGKFAQVWFHLKALEDEGVLKHADYNEWQPTKRTPEWLTSYYPVGPRR